MSDSNSNFILTFNGLKHPSELDSHVIAPDGNFSIISNLDRTIRSITEVPNSKCRTIFLTNGISATFSTDHLLKTNDTWKKVGDLKLYDDIQMSFPRKIDLAPSIQVNMEYNFQLCPYTLGKISSRAWIFTDNLDFKVYGYLDHKFVYDELNLLHVHYSCSQCTRNSYEFSISDEKFVNQYKAIFKNLYSCFQFGSEWIYTFIQGALISYNLFQFPSINLYNFPADQWAILVLGFTDSGIEFNYGSRFLKVAQRGTKARIQKIRQSPNSETTFHIACPGEQYLSNFIISHS